MGRGRPQVLAGGPHQVRRHRPHHPGVGLGTSDPKECHPEYPRSYQNGRRADYAMFGIPDVQAIGNNAVPPDIIIESKPLWAELDGAVP